MKIDFNQGLDARLIDNEVAEKLKKMRLMCVRISYDHNNEREAVKNAIDLLITNGIRGRKILVYVLYNWEDDPDNFFNRVRDVLSWGGGRISYALSAIRCFEKKRLHFVKMG
ncbi:hypothetical protein ES703_94806 [subsurface metagenome]